jgi:hypothetical protein
MMQPKCARLFLWDGCSPIAVAGGGPQEFAANCTAAALIGRVD